MKLAIVSTLLAGAAAFAPSSVSRSGTELAATRAVKDGPPKSGKKNLTFNKGFDDPVPPQAEGLIGVLPPVGYWDPLGLAEKRSAEAVQRSREVEIIHGRFAQLAIVGFLVPESYAASGAYGDDFLAPTGTALEAFNTDPIWLALTFGIIAALETVRILQTEPGNRVNAGILENGLYSMPTPERLEELKLKELQNGRLAMLAFGESSPFDLNPRCFVQFNSTHSFLDRNSWCRRTGVGQRDPSPCQPPGLILVPETSAQYMSRQ